MDALTSIGLVLWTLVSLGLTLNVIHPLMNRDKAKPLNLLLGFGLGWIIGELAPQWILLNMGGFLLLQIFSDLGNAQLVLSRNIQCFFLNSGNT